MLVSIAVRGWLTSCAIDAVNSPKTDTRAAWAISARRFERLTHAAKVRVVAGCLVRVASNQPVKGSRHEPTVGRERCAIAIATVLVVSEHRSPILVAIEDPVIAARIETENGRFGSPESAFGEPPESKPCT